MTLAESVPPRYDVLTLHPEMVRTPLQASILGRAAVDGKIAVGVHNIRDWALGKHQVADDHPFGGGAGMVMKVDVVASALEAIRGVGHVILTSPSGRPFSQRDAVRLAALPHLVFVCGHYEGIDARIETLVDEELSIGDFVLTGGEIAALAMVDAVARLVPGVLGNANSTVEESFGAGLLEYPQYTRPREWRGLEVPEVLLSGHHTKIKEWRRQQAEERTKLRRPDLWERHLTKVDVGDAGR